MDDYADYQDFDYPFTQTFFDEDPNCNQHVSEVDQNQERSKEIQAERHNLLTRLKQLDREYQLLNPQEIQTDINSQLSESKTRRKSSSLIKFPKDPNTTNPILEVQNPLTTVKRSLLSKRQQQSLHQIQQLSQAQLCDTIRLFGIKKAPKTRMIKELERIRDYQSNLQKCHPYMVRLLK